MAEMSMLGMTPADPALSWRLIFARGLTCLALVLCLVAGTPSADAADAVGDYNVSVQLYRQNRWALAAESFRKFLKDYPNHEKTPFAQLFLGLTLVNQADFQGAREILRGFVKSYPQNTNLPQAKYRVAECSYLLNDLPAAQTELQAYLKDHPQDPLVERALPYLGDVQLRLNEPAAASATFAEAVQRFPEGALIDDAQFGWAKSLEAERKFDEAIAKFEALAKGGGSRAAEALFQIGSREFDSGRFAEAATAYRSLTERFPTNPLAVDAHLNAGFALYRQQDFAAAAAEFESAAKDPVRELQGGYWRALCLKSQALYPAAIEALAGLEGKVGQDPIAEAVVFQRGMCERLAGRSAEAQATLVATVTRFPTGEYADDALHFATELAIEAGNLTGARERLDQFARDYPRSGLRMYQELLAGRYELASAAAKTNAGTPQTEIDDCYVAAGGHFDKVLQESTLARTRSQSRYYLALTRQLQGDHAQALQVMQPLVEEVLAAQPSAAEFGDILVLQADSLSQTQKFPEAIAAAQAYVDRYAQGRQRARALSLLALAQAQGGKLPESLQTMTLLRQESPQATVTSTTLLRLAELADGRSDWPMSADLYGQLVTISGETENAAFGLRGQGWAQYQQKDYPAAVTSFAAFETRFPDHRLAPEVGYYRAEALREQGQLPEAATAFAATFRKFAPAEPAPAGAEESGSLLFAYRAGVQAARTHRKAQNVDAADAVYAMVVEKFPKLKSLDRLLDEWAILNYEAERFDKADEVFRRLVRDTPDSDLADNAQLSLAESDLIADRLEPARKAFEELRVSPKSDAVVRERALYQLLVLALEERRWKEVLTLGSEYRKTFPESPSLRYVDYAAAEAVLADPATTAERLEPLLGVLAKMTEQLPPESEAWAPRLWVLSAEAQFRLKRYEEISTTVADLKQRQPDSKLTYQAEEVLGRALKQQAKFPEAREALERALADPAAFRTETAAKCQFLIAETWYLQEKWKEAFLAYQKVYTSYAYPEWQAAALLQSGKCDEQQGNTKEAIAAYDQLIQEFPMSTHIDEARKRLEQAKLKTGSRN